MAKFHGSMYEEADPDDWLPLGNHEDSEYAAERFAEIAFHSHHMMEGNNEFPIWIKSVDGPQEGQIEKFEIEVEARPHFRARKA